MAWCKTGVSDNLGENFFSSKVPEFLHLDFNALENHGHAPFFAEVCFGFEKLHMQKNSICCCVSARPERCRFHFKMQQNVHFTQNVSSNMMISNQNC